MSLFIVCFMIDNKITIYFYSSKIKDKLWKVCSQKKTFNVIGTAGSAAKN